MRRWGWIAILAGCPKGAAPETAASARADCASLVAVVDDLKAPVPEAAPTEVVAPMRDMVAKLDGIADRLVPLGARQDAIGQLALDYVSFAHAQGETMRGILPLAERLESAGKAYLEWQTALDARPASDALTEDDLRLGGALGTALGSAKVDLDNHLAEVQASAAGDAGATARLTALDGRLRALCPQTGP